MRWIDALAAAFINTFGITQPDDRTRRRASWFILGMLTLVLLSLGILGSLLLRVLRG